MGGSETFEAEDVACHVEMLARCGHRAEDGAAVQAAAEAFTEKARHFARAFRSDKAADPRELLLSVGVMREAVDRLVGEVKQVEDHLAERRSGWASAAPPQGLNQLSPSSAALRPVARRAGRREGVATLAMPVSSRREPFEGPGH